MRTWMCAVLSLVPRQPASEHWLPWAPDAAAAARRPGAARWSDVAAVGRVMVLVASARGRRADVFQGRSARRPPHREIELAGDLAGEPQRVAALAHLVPDREEALANFRQ
jgi:hypothetical protein